MKILHCLKLSLNAFLEMLEKTFCYYDFKKEKETKTAMSLSAKGRDMSKAIKSSANKRRGKKAYNIKSVYSVNSKNQINNYESITDASKKTNISISSISNNLSNKTKTAGGLIWHYQKKI